MKRSAALIPVALLLFVGIVPAREAEGEGGPVPRTILALYDGTSDTSIRYGTIHQFAEMPLNHLGLMVHHHDIRDGLPDLDDIADLRGILTWFSSDRIVDPEAYLDWAVEAVESGISLVIMEGLGAWADHDGRATPVERVNRLFEAIGLRYADRYVDVTYRSRVAHADPVLMEFERAIPEVLPAYDGRELAAADVESHLGIAIDGDPGRISHQVVTGPRGGYAADGFVIFTANQDAYRQWILNPFEFFRRCFRTDEIPKPDPCTLVGRRIFYSHIDGDGWFNRCLINEYRQRGANSAEALLEQVFEPYSDLPVTIGPVTGDFEPERFGTPEAMELVRRIFALENVEAGTHTHTHPFDWGFFEEYSPEKERRFREPREGSGGYEGAGHVHGGAGGGEAEDVVLENNYSRPRAYLDRPFDLEQELGGSAAFLQPFLPAGKRVEVVQWSGNTAPFPRAIRLCREAGLRNINGGDSRFDPAHPSYAGVAPVGLQVGDQRQIYASGANEVIYTDLWESRHHGLRDHRHFVRNTETPRRVAPFNLYYHTFSGERQAGINAVTLMLDLARAQEVVPITTSHYAAVGDGFYSTRLVALGDRSWSVEDRDGLQTLRFDRASRLAVDFARSEGVLGQRHTHGSLYVALDPAAATPVVALKENPRLDRPPASDRPYLVQSRWVLSDLRGGAAEWRVRARGFGDGTMAWRAEPGARYGLEAFGGDGSAVWRGNVVADDDGLLAFTVPANAIHPLELRFWAHASSTGGP